MKNSIPVSLTLFFILFTVVYAATIHNWENEEYDKMHPQMHHRLVQGRRNRRGTMPPIMFEPPALEKHIDYWINDGQNILKKQLEKNDLNTNVAKNIILFLGDGLGIPTITAARVYMGGEEKQLSFENFPYVGLSKTYCANTQVADSACTATAYLGGVKGNYGTIGVSAAVQLDDCKAVNDTRNHVDSIAQWAQESGKTAGLITTTQVTHASPAGVYAHTANRNWESDKQLRIDGGDPNQCMDIAKQLIYNSVGRNLRVVMGGGLQEFQPETEQDILSGQYGKRTDNVNLIDVWKQTHSEETAAYVQTKDELLNVPKDTKYLLGLFANDHMPFHLDADNKTIPTLAEMVDKALDVLEVSGENGYFLFVEGGRIDHAHHNTEAVKAIDETIEFDKAIDLARRRTNEQNTLIVVTSDHSHTMSIAGYSSRNNDIFGINNAQNANDELPYATLSYANGPGFHGNFVDGKGKRRNLQEVNMKDKNYRFPSTVPLDSETHGGEDVPVFASGPWAHLFTGTYEQNYIPHAMGYAACIGKGRGACTA